MRRGLWWVALLIAVPLVAGCAGRMADRQLQRVARDWSMVIRASQVLPVYPLTEDLQPGDVFLVQTPVEEQVRLYRRRGFLPLDNLIHRINPSGYPDFYARSWEVGAGDRLLPKTWLEPGKDTAWRQAPRAAFPTYAFSARAGAGLSVALPVQGVPVGIGLLGGEAAQGSITIADAHTYGVDTTSLYQDVLAWGLRERTFLRHFAPAEGKQNYLRVLTRVYLTGRLNTSLQSSRDIAGSVSGGAPKPVDLVVGDPQTNPQEATVEAYKSNVSKLTELIQEALRGVGGAQGVLPGGTVKVVAASAGSVVLSETFARPLVLGYLGFDVPILEGGALGPPIPTHAVLEGGRRPTGGPVDPSASLRSGRLLAAVYDVLDAHKERDPQARSLAGRLDALAGRLPERYPSDLATLAGPRGPLAFPRKSGEVLPRQTFRDLVRYRGDLAASIQALRFALLRPDVAVEGAPARAAATDQALIETRARNEAALRQVNELLDENALLVRQAAEHAAAAED